MCIRDSASALGGDAEHVLVCSTGLIGSGDQAFRDKIVNGVPALTAALSAEDTTAPAAILTTDSVEKTASHTSEAGWTIGAMAKGAGMLAPGPVSYTHLDVYKRQHRHIPEIQQSLRGAGAGDPRISFTPVLVPMSRGILATSTATVAPGVAAEQVREAWVNAYADETFVHVLPEGQFPRTADTLGANTCLMGVAIDESAGRVVVVAALDNLCLLYTSRCV